VAEYQPPTAIPFNSLHGSYRYTDVGEG